ncbi:MAG TPA: NAD-dependent epimerase/dehydratase family protein [Noviherbaspirillum sp.]|uniref:NAD-dependent epimerase/dehydratase family protein n=1 Tax=Noviherbaspirillum sp. TaxID=1926288 RepID=UPI002D2DA53D|nr:NAD-dependent epimerase/dehydratase family protein [Noviherbaspirillum sp.]HYD95594.1 NAD-dependent epimerase/dehydratase family protein [Noviherbaspirillum sp.]
MASPSDGTPASRGRVLLTGANGFTGKYVRAELEAAGYTVVGALVGAARGPHEVTLDITSPDNCRRVMEKLRPDYLIHLAAISFVAHADADAFYRVNVIGTINLLQAMADAGVTPRRVLIASSANVYGNATAGVIAETQAPQPVNHYAVSKLAMEYMVRTWNDRLPIVITRPFNYTGVGQEPHFLVPKIVSHFVQRAPLIELGNLDVERDFSDVRMVARAYRGLLEQERTGEIVNICSGRPYSLRAIIGHMQQIAGYEIDVRVNPAFVRQSEVKTLVGAPDKLRSLVAGLDPIPLEDTLRWMYDAGTAAH